MFRGQSLIFFAYVRKRKCDGLRRYIYFWIILLLSNNLSVEKIWFKFGARIGKFFVHSIQYVGSFQALRFGRGEIIDTEKSEYDDKWLNQLILSEFQTISFLMHIARSNWSQSRGITQNHRGFATRFYWTSNLKSSRDSTVGLYGAWKSDKMSESRNMNGVPHTDAQSDASSESSEEEFFDIIEHGSRRQVWKIIKFYSHEKKIRKEKF